MPMGAMEQEIALPKRDYQVPLDRQPAYLVAHELETRGATCFQEGSLEPGGVG